MYSSICAGRPMRRCGSLLITWTAAITLPNWSFIGTQRIEFVYPLERSTAWLNRASRYALGIDDGAVLDGEADDPRAGHVDGVQRVVAQLRPAAAAEGVGRGRRARAVVLRRVGERDEAAGGAVLRRFEDGGAVGAGRVAESTSFSSSLEALRLRALQYARRQRHSLRLRRLRRPLLLPPRRLRRLAPLVLGERGGGRRGEEANNLALRRRERTAAPAVDHLVAELQRTERGRCGGAADEDGARPKHCRLLGRDAVRPKARVVVGVGDREHLAAVEGARRQPRVRHPSDGGESLASGAALSPGRAPSRRRSRRRRGRVRC